jgi:hypothetical protein
MRSPGKRIENRTWKPPASIIGQRIAIHGGKVPVAKAYRVEVANILNELAHRHGPPKGFMKTGGGFMGIDQFVTPGIVATVVIDRYVEFGIDDICEQDPWFDKQPGNIGWVLRDVIVLPKPVPCRGAQGLWNVPDDVLAEIKKASDQIGLTLFEQGKAD